VGRGNWSAEHPAVSAMAVGQIDYHMYKPWIPVERILYPAVTEILAAWHGSQDSPLVGVHIVGPQWSVRAHELRDVLTRIGIPYRFYAEDSAEGRHLLREAGVDGGRLPVLVFYEGTVLVDPTHADLMGFIGVATRPSLAACDVA